jgi:5-methylcytosine-specific restriction endonuclease McrA
MHRIPAPAVDSVEVLDEITAAKQQPTQRRLTAVRRRVVTAYNAYEDAVPSVETLAPIAVTNVQRNALHHAYTVATIPMQELREKLSAPVMAGRCPFCGISETGALDHYLPKESYPEFSVFAWNLVPSCAKCNTRKRTLVIDEHTDVRMFLHPYFDEIPNEPFLGVRVTLLADTLRLRFRIRRPAGMSLPCYRQLRSHFTQLGLADRYQTQSLIELRGRHGSFARFYGPDADSARVASELVAEADTYEAAHGPNHWRVVLYRELAIHNAFCDGGFEVISPTQ